MTGLRTELHRHLDVSVRTSTLLELAQERGLEALSTSLEAFRAKHVMRKPLTDLATVLAEFTLYQHVLDRPEVLERVAFEVIEDVRREGTRAVELRWSPGFVCQLSHLPWEDALDGFEAGIRKALATYPEMKAGMLCIASRDLGADSVLRTVEFFLKHPGRFVGLDLAGPEEGYPARDFEGAFRKAKDRGARITVHAGEGSGPENVWDAIENLGATRIGHGIAAIQDRELMARLAKDAICLENCPTSNWLTQCVPDLAHHPLPRFLRAGVPVCINTDDPGIFGVTLPQEIEVCRSQMGMSEAEIEECFKHAARASFL
jgi:adenosine deaminase